MELKRLELETDEIAAWTSIMQSFSYAHPQGVVHQAIKPHNCLINRSGQLVLADFGLSRQNPVMRGETIISYTRTKATLAFSAPEQFTGEAPVPAHDIYALGAPLYSLAS